MKTYGTEINHRIQIGDYKKSDFQKAMFILKEDEDKKYHSCPFLIFDKTECVYLHDATRTKIKYSEINKISISICSRICNLGKISANPLVLSNDISEEPIRVGFHGITYCMDLTFELKNFEVLKFESFSFVNSADILNLLDRTLVNDPYDILPILEEKDIDIKFKKISLLFPKILKQYDLDNPRGTVTFY